MSIKDYSSAGWRVNMALCEGNFEYTHAMQVRYRYARRQEQCIRMYHYIRVLFFSFAFPLNRFNPQLPFNSCSALTLPALFISHLTTCFSVVSSLLLRTFPSLLSLPLSSFLALKHAVFIYSLVSTYILPLVY